jgi:hypothetical protein
MARGVARSTRGGQGRRRISTGFDPYSVPRNLNRINRLMTPAQRRGDFTDPRSRPQVIAETARRGGSTGNAGGGGGIRTPASGTRRRGGGLNAIRNARNVRPGGGDRRIRTGFDPENPRTRNRINRFMTAEQQRGDFTDLRSRPRVIAETARRGGRTGNAGGGSTSGDPQQSRGSRRAASVTAPTPAVRPRPSEARAARGQLIRQIANRRQNARRSQRTI